MTYDISTKIKAEAFVQMVVESTAPPSKIRNALEEGYERADKAANREVALVFKHAIEDFA